MKQPTILLIAFVFFLNAGPTLAQEKYAIKFKELRAGDFARIESKETSATKSQLTIEKEKGPAKTSESKISKHLLFTESILERPDIGKMPTKIRRVYDKAEEQQSSEPKSQKQMAYHGKTLLIEKKGGKYEFHLEGGAAVKDDVILENEFNNTDPEMAKKLFAPSMPVAEGQSWKVDTKSLLGGQAKEDKVEVKKAEGTAKLTKVYKKGAHLHGVIECMTEVELKSWSEDKQLKGQVTSENKTIMKITYDGCIDGTAAEGRVAIAFEFNSTTVFRAANEPDVTSHNSGVITVEESFNEIAKK